MAKHMRSGRVHLAEIVLIQTGSASAQGLQITRLRYAWLNSTTCMRGSAGDGVGAMDQAELTALNVELGEVTPLMEAYSALTRLHAEAAELEALAASAEEPDMRKLAAEELQTLLVQVQLFQVALLN